MERKKVQGTGEKVTAIAFVLCAFAGVFLSMHKDAVMEGRIVEVMVAYVETAQ